MAGRGPEPRARSGHPRDHDAEQDRTSASTTSGILAENPDALEHVKEILIVDQGTQKVEDQDGFAAVQDCARRQAADHQPGQPRRLRRLRPRHVRGRRERQRLRPAAGRRHRRRARKHHPRCSPSRTTAASRRSSAATCSTSTTAASCTPSARSSTRTGSGRRCRTRTWNCGTISRRANLRQTAVAAPPGRRGLQRLVDVPDPDHGHPGNRPVAARSSSSGTTPSTGCAPRQRGFPTVSLPGAAVWHVSWIDKDDLVGWQAYFHARNRLDGRARSTAPTNRAAGSCANPSYADVKHLVSMQYCTEHGRIEALEGRAARARPTCTDLLPTKLPEIRKMMAGLLRLAVSARTWTSSRRRRWTSRRAAGTACRSRPGSALLPGRPRLSLGSCCRPGRPRPARNARRRSIAHQDNRWWRMAQYDSALVSNAEGTGRLLVQAGPQADAGHADREQPAARCSCSRTGGR